ncbi:DUF1778 domain-containing protein [Blastochloris sulfoviridis]|uniref:DUF1778 domain-containing protein n=1 Tax=Blastochloris sulfoviridis TaxID=50712 RepID=A0A5M6HJY9_9HYPH|nr:DUF1778 domain-containing protein [Blastochloris sulfoviridis]KAA5595938.1 DUF1778 domain-containing protein [Blastochloris sulfoviridis]
MSIRSTRSEKLDLRLSASAKQTLRRAAEASHKTLTEFVLDSAVQRAEEVLAEHRSIRLSPEDWAEFQQRLDAPPVVHPRLARLLQDAGPAD